MKERNLGRMVGILAIVLMLGILTVPVVMAKNSADCDPGAGFVSGEGNANGKCTNDADCRGDWSCLAASPDKYFQATEESFCMTDKHSCCWKWDSGTPCPHGKVCHIPDVAGNPKNTEECWCIDDPLKPKTAADGCEESSASPDISGARISCDSIKVPDDFKLLIQTTLCILWRIIQGIVAILAALVIALAGLRWLSTDNPEERDRAKKMIASVVVGAVIIIIALQLANLLVLRVGWADFNCNSVSGEEGITSNINDVACVLFTLIQGIAAIISLVVIVIAGIKWATSDSSEERLHAKSLVIGAIAGFIIILIAGNFVRALFFGDDNALMGDVSCNISEDSIGDVKTQIEDIGCMLFMTLFFSTGIIVSLVIVIVGIKWMSSESPEDRSDAKRWLIHALIGLVIVMVASQLIWAMTSVLFNMDLKSGGFWDFLGSLFGKPYLLTCLSKLLLHGSVWILIGQIHTIFCIFVRAMQAVAAVAAALYLTLAGLRLVGTDDPESRMEAKRKIFNVLVGFMIAMLALSIVDMLSVLAMLKSLFGNVFLIGNIIGFLSKHISEDFLCPSFFKLGGEYFVKQLQYIFCVLIKIIQLVTVILAGIVIMLSSIKWSTSDDPESRTEAKTRILYALVGLAVIVLALQVVHVLLSGKIDLKGFSPLDACDDTDMGGDIGDKTRYLGCVIVRIIEASAALISGLVIVIAGIRWMSIDSPEDKSVAKGYIVHALIGLAIVIIALQLVNTLVDGTDITNFNPGCGVPENIKNSIWIMGCSLIKIIQFVAGFLGALIVIVSGLIWISSGDDLAKRVQAKAIMISAIIGIVIVVVGLQLANSLIFPGTSVLAVTCPEEPITPPTSTTSTTTTTLPTGATADLTATNLNPCKGDTITLSLDIESTREVYQALIKINIPVGLSVTSLNAEGFMSSPTPSANPPEYELVASTTSGTTGGFSLGVSCDTPGSYNIEITHLKLLDSTGAPVSVLLPNPLNINVGSTCADTCAGAGYSTGGCMSDIGWEGHHCDGDICYFGLKEAGNSCDCNAQNPCYCYMSRDCQANQCLLRCEDTGCV